MINQEKIGELFIHFNEIIKSTTKRPKKPKALKPNIANKCSFGNELIAAPGCKSFYQCVHPGTIHQRVHTFACPLGLLFDNNLKVCNWPANVICAD